MKQKRIAAIHDISGIGKCSLTVALPICSAAGLETAVIPTALLSNHTGVCFNDYTFCDLTDQIMPIAHSWKKQGFSFDAFYSGYLGSVKQTDLVSEVISLLKSDASVVIVDPVMGDNGRLYSGIDTRFPEAMLTLCKNADIIIPNITEACLLLGCEYKNAPYSEDYIEDLLKNLYKKCGAKVVLTGVTFDERKVGAASFDGESVTYAFSPRVDKIFHGTGDIFASSLVAAYLNGKTLTEATDFAVDFTYNCIKGTIESGDERDYGVCFEKELPRLIKFLENI